jgi:hypothetical protein
MRLLRIVNVALLCAALFGLSRSTYAQLPLQPGNSTPPVSAPLPAPPAGRVLVAPPAPVVQQAAPAAQPAPAAPVVQPGSSGCTACGECPKKKICVGEPDKKVVTNVKYRCQCKTICLPNCSACGKGCGSCETGCDSGCGQQECGKPREVRRLYKRFVTEEQRVIACKPVDAPACTASCATSCETGLAPCPKCSTPCGTAPSGPIPMALPSPTTIPGSPAIQPQPIPPGAQQPINNAAKTPAGH